LPILRATLSLATVVSRRLARRLVELEVGRVRPIRVHGRFDQGPAQLGRAGLGELAAKARLSRLVDDRVEAGQAGDLLGAAEAARLVDLGEQMAGEDRADPLDRLQRPSSCVGAGEAAQLAVDRIQLHSSAAMYR
jgi:hypothetical protein